MGESVLDGVNVGEGASGVKVGVQRGLVCVLSIVSVGVTMGVGVAEGVPTTVGEERGVSVGVPKGMGVEVCGASVGFNPIKA